MDLSTRAARHGVATRYRSDRGEWVDVPPATVEAVLVALGEDDAADAAGPPPAAVAWNGDWLGQTLPFGLHRRGDTLVISAPRRVPAPRRRHWGLFAPVPGLHSARTRHLGDLADLSALVDLVVGHGGDTVLTLPLNATFAPDEASPYSPVSRRFWNELAIALDRVPEIVAAGLAAPHPPDRHVDVARAHDALSRALAAGRAGLDGLGRRATAFARFTTERPDAVAFATWRAGHGHQHPAIDPDDRIEHHLYAQWLLDEQLTALAEHARRAGALLGLDLALGTHPGGFDVATYDEFVPGVTVGAPPDHFFPNGQDWGFPPVHPRRSREHGHRVLREALAAHLRFAGLLRIDHVMGLARQYWIPAGAGPHEGTYVQYPLEELMAIVCLEAHLAGALVAGENIGTVPPEIDRAMADHGILGTWVAQGAVEALVETGRAAPAPAASLASINTHDMPTLVGFLAGADVDERAALGLVDERTAGAQRERRRLVRAAVERHVGSQDPARILGSLVGEMVAGPAAVVVISVDDLGLEPEGLNLPGTSDERPNWTRVCPGPLEDLDDLPAARTVFAALSRGMLQPPEGDRE